MSKVRPNPQKYGFTLKPWRNSEALTAWKMRMSQPRDHVLRDGYVARMLEDQDFAIAIPEEPRSLYDPEQLYAALERYSPDKTSYPEMSVDIKAGFDFAYAAFARREDQEYLKPLTLDSMSVMELTSHLTGSAGLTAFGLKKGDVMDEALQRSQLLVQELRVPEPCIAFARTQFHNKTRLVWGYPYSMTILEGLVARPLLEYMKRGLTPMAFAMPTGVLGTKLRVAAYNKTWAYALDMSKFDSSICQMFIRHAFRIIRTWFDMEQEVYNGRTTSQLFDVIERYFVYTPILMPDGMVYRGKRHGVPSGSYFTQLVDSIVNTIVIGAISSHFHMRVMKRFTSVLGDDSLFWSDVKVSLQRIAQFVHDELGMTVHADEKSSIVKQNMPVHFLGRNWTKGVPDLPIEDIAVRLLYTETFREYSKDKEVALRQVKLMILAIASTYWKNGWKLVRWILGGKDTIFLDFESIEYRIYDRSRTPSELEADGVHLSGLQRFRLRYELGGERSIRTTTISSSWK